MKNILKKLKPACILICTVILTACASIEREKTYFENSILLESFEEDYYSDDWQSEGNSSLCIKLNQLKNEEPYSILECDIPPKKNIMFTADFYSTFSYGIKVKMIFECSENKFTSPEQILFPGENIGVIFVPEQTDALEQDLIKNICLSFTEIKSTGEIFADNINFIP